MTADEAPAAPPKKRGFALPSAYTILFILIVLVAIGTWIIPAGQYQLDENGQPIPGSYEQVEQNPQRIIADSLLAPINGLFGIEAEDGSISVWNSGELFGAIDVALFVLVIGGFLGITMKTGAINDGIARIVSRFRGREQLMIPILMIVFAIGGTTFGMNEESLAFYVLIITVMVAAGYDTMVGASLLLLGCGIGVLGSTINPFATGIASGFAGTSIDEGLIGRLVILVVGTAIGIWFVMRYAAKVKSDPTKSMVYAQKAENEAAFRGADTTTEDAALPGREKAVLGLFFLAFVVMIYGVIPWEDLGVPLPTLWWWFPEMTASFLLFAILIGVVGRMNEGELASTFVDGARDLLGVALIIGIARGITVVMNNGLITDTVLNAAEQAVAGVGGVVFINLMYGLFLPLSFLIPSSSGLATVAMPIMAPLAGFAGVPEYLVVTAYQTGNGLINLITPTSAVVMGGLAIARIGYGTWLRFVWPMLLILAILSMLVLTVPILIQ
ncbi:MAG TPA: YfcC family protein [Candidatus Limnocylindria bacterium]